MSVELHSLTVDAGPMSDEPEVPVSPSLASVSESVPSPHLQRQPSLITPVQIRQLGKTIDIDAWCDYLRCCFHSIVTQGIGIQTATLERVDRWRILTHVPAVSLKERVRLDEKSCKDDQQAFCTVKDVLRSYEMACLRLHAAYSISGHFKNLRRFRFRWLLATENEQRQLLRTEQVDRRETFITWLYLSLSTLKASQCVHDKSDNLSQQPLDSQGLMEKFPIEPDGTISVQQILVLCQASHWLREYLHEKRAVQLQHRARSSSLVHSQACTIGIPDVVSKLLSKMVVPGSTLMAEPYAFVRLLLDTTSPSLMRQVQFQLKNIAEAFLHFKVGTASIQASGRMSQEDVKRCVQSLLQGNNNMCESAIYDIIQSSAFSSALQPFFGGSSDPFETFPVAHFPALFMEILSISVPKSAGVDLNNELPFAASKICRGSRVVGTLRWELAFSVIGCLMFWPVTMLVALTGDHRWRAWKLWFEQSQVAYSRVHIEEEDKEEDNSSAVSAASIPNRNRRPPVNSSSIWPSRVGLVLSAAIWLLPVLSVALFMRGTRTMCDRLWLNALDLNSSIRPLTGQCSVNGEDCHYVTVYEAFFPLFSFLFGILLVGLTVGYHPSQSVVRMKLSSLENAMSEVSVEMLNTFTGYIFCASSAATALDVLQSAIIFRGKKPFSILRTIFCCWPSYFSPGKVAVYVFALSHAAAPMLLRNIASSLSPSFSDSPFGCGFTDWFISVVYIVWSIVFSFFLFNLLRRMLFEVRRIQLQHERLIDAFRGKADAHIPDAPNMDAGDDSSDALEEEQSPAEPLPSVPSEHKSEVQAVQRNPSRMIARQDTEKRLHNSERQNRQLLQAAMFDTGDSVDHFSSMRLSFSDPNSVVAFSLLRKYLIIDCQQALNGHSVLLTLSLLVALAVFIFCFLQLQITLSWTVAISRILALALATMITCYCSLAIHRVSLINKVLSSHEEFLCKAHADIVFAMQMQRAGMSSFQLNSPADGDVKRRSPTWVTSPAHRPASAIPPTLPDQTVEDTQKRLDEARILLHTLRDVVQTSTNALTILGLTVSPQLNTLLISFLLSTTSSFLFKFLLSSRT